MIKCELCDKEFKSITNTHTEKSHGITLKEYINRFGEFRSQQTSELLANNRPDYSGENNPMYGKKAWNSGLTKDDDIRIKQYSRSGSEHSQWVGGRLKRAGYIELDKSLIEPEFHCMIQQSVNRVQEHRYVMAKHLGRPLTEIEVVHHIDNDGTNNDISNLMLFPTQADHLLWHKKLGDVC